MKLKKAEVIKIAKLSNIPVSKEEVEKFRTQLSSIISYVKKLREVDTSQEQPTSQTTGLTDVYREDLVNNIDILSQKDALSGTDRIHNDYFVVPTVFKKE